MIKIPACLLCKNFMECRPTGEKDTYGDDVMMYICKAYPDGIPKLKWDQPEDECVPGIGFKE